MSELWCEHVSVTMGERVALQDVSFHPQPGFTALIGPNGAGKTTLLRILSGYLRADEGSAFLDGRPLGEWSSRERAQRIAVVAQQTVFDYAFSVLDVVLMGRTPWKRAFESDTSRDVRMAEEALQMTGAAEFRNRLITELSGGERQRVLIARALCQDTPVLLLDEPVSALDLRHQTGILRAVRQAAEDRSLTCVCVLHDLNLAARFADTMTLMNRGRIVMSGAPGELLHQDILESVYQTRVRVLKDEEGLYVLAR